MTNKPIPLIRRHAVNGVPRLALAALMLCTLGATAQPKPGEGQGGGPPAEALAACKTTKAGDACSFSGPQGKASGSCWAPQGRALACRPKDAPAPGNKAPAN